MDKKHRLTPQQRAERKKQREETAAKIAAVFADFAEQVDRGLSSPENPPTEASTSE